MFQSIKVKNIFLRLLPYFISIASGTIFYIAANKWIEDEGLNGLIVNIAAALLSIPLIFIFYEVISNMCTKNIKNSLFEHLCFEINYIIIDVIKNTRKMLNITDELNEDSLFLFLKKDKIFIKDNLVIQNELSKLFKSDKDKLLDLSYGQSSLEALSEPQINCLLSIAKNLGILSKEIEYIDTTGSRTLVEDNILELLSLLARWIDLCEDNAIINHHSFKLI